MPIYLAPTYFKYSDPQKTNKIGFEDLKSLMCCVFTWIYKDQLFNSISKNEILFSLFPCNHRRTSKVNGKYVWEEADGWECDFLSTALRSLYLPPEILKKGVGLFSLPFQPRLLTIKFHFHSSLVKAIGESS